MDLLEQEEIEIISPHKTALEHNLSKYFDRLAKCGSTAELKRSPLFRELEPEINRVLSTVDVDNAFGKGLSNPRRSALQVTAWNIERGMRIDGILKALRNHPSLNQSDVLLLTELDLGMARTGNRFIAREVAEAVEMNFAFAPSYINLEKGSGLEARAQGENREAVHGNAIFSRFPLLHAHSLALPNGKDKMRGKEKRLGSQRAVIAEISHPEFGGVRFVSVHLDAHSTQKHRLLQMKIILDHLETLSPRLPAMIGGDWNTTTYNSRRAAYAIAGFARRVAMGPGKFIRKHYPHPYRWFERGLFAEIERRGFDFRNFNEYGVGTLHYDVKSIAQNTNLGDWVPRWCFWFMEKALAKQGGRASLKLDWFAARGLAVDPAFPPKVIGNLVDEGGPLSDHDAITVGVRPLEQYTVTPK